jgi:Fe2+ transport system protein FeoA
MGKIQSSTFPFAAPTLAELPIGVPARVTGVCLNAFEARRMAEYGLVPGTPVAALFRSFGGNLTAFEIRGAVIALRRETSEGIRVRIEQ